MDRWVVRSEEEEQRWLCLGGGSGRSPPPGAAAAALPTHLALGREREAWGAACEGALVLVALQAGVAAVHITGDGPDDVALHEWEACTGGKVSTMRLRPNISSTLPLCHAHRGAQGVAPGHVASGALLAQVWPPIGAARAQLHVAAARNGQALAAAAVGLALWAGALRGRGGGIACLQGRGDWQAGRPAPTASAACCQACSSWHTPCHPPA